MHTVPGQSKTQKLVGMLLLVAGGFELTPADQRLVTIHDLTPLTLP